MVRHNDWLRSSAKLARQTGSKTLWQRMLTLKPVAGLASWYCYLVRQSDCLLVAAER